MTEYTAAHLKSIGQAILILLAIVAIGAFLMPKGYELVPWAIMFIWAILPIKHINNYNSIKEWWLDRRNWLN